MEYLYGTAENYEDFSSGRVIYGGRGIPNFPARLVREIFGRSLAQLNDKERIRVYDPCCGGAYSLTILGFFYGERIEKIYASDADEEMAAHARKNLSLLTEEGLIKRQGELEELYRKYGKASHLEAAESAERLMGRLAADVEAEVFTADCTKELPDIHPDIIITDVPYGDLVSWEGSGGMTAMLGQLWKIAHEDTVLAVCMDKSQKIVSDGWKRIEKQNIGKRRFEILKCVKENRPL